MSFSRESEPMLPFEGSHETEELASLRAEIRDVLREYVAEVRTSTDPRALERILRTLELGAPSLRREAHLDNTERRRMERKEDARRRNEEGFPPGYKSFMLTMSDRALVSTRQAYRDWLAGRSETFYSVAPPSRPTEEDLVAIEYEMRRRGLL